MAHKTMQLTEAGAQNYRTRMMVGDPIVLSGSDARRLEKIGWVEEPKRARQAKVEQPEQPPIIPTVDEVLNAEVVDEPKKAAPKRATRRKAKK